MSDWRTNYAPVLFSAEEIAEARKVSAEEMSRWLGEHIASAHERNAEVLAEQLRTLYAPLDSVEQVLAKDAARELMEFELAATEATLK